MFVELGPGPGYCFLLDPETLDLDAVNKRLDPKPWEYLE